MNCFDANSNVIPNHTHKLEKYTNEMMFLISMIDQNDIKDLPDKNYLNSIYYELNDAYLSCCFVMAIYKKIKDSVQLKKDIQESNNKLIKILQHNGIK